MHLDAFAAGLPTCELGARLEGALEPGAPGGPAGAPVRREDFRDLAAACLRRAAGQGVRRVEVSVDAQVHVARGAALEDVLGGCHEAVQRARAELGLSAGLVLRLAREAPVGGAEAVPGAEAVLEEVLAGGPEQRARIAGVALGPGGPGGGGQPPERFAPLLERARSAGYRLSAP
ncbi:hypothetical protein GTR00_18155, partial [Kineococcus sp. T90]